MAVVELDEIEQLLPIPPDVLVTDTGDLPSGKPGGSRVSASCSSAMTLPSASVTTLSPTRPHIVLGHVDERNDRHATEAAAQALGEVLQRLAHAVLGVEALQRRVSVLEGSS